MKVAIIVNKSWNVINFRLGLIRELMISGHEVVTITSEDDYTSRLHDLKIRNIAVPLDAKGKHPGRDLLLIWRYWCFLKHEKPDVCLTYTIKPNIYGSLAAHALGIPVISTITGLGEVYGRENLLSKTVSQLYKYVFSRSSKVFFQNGENLQMFLSKGLIQKKKAIEVPGSGVDLEHFYLSQRPFSKEKFRFLFIGRLLWDKGIAEFVEAARMIRKKRQDVEFCLLGFIEQDRVSAVSPKHIEDWEKEEVVKYLGATGDVREDIERADCVVLPSFYGEGTPRSLLEAAAMGRPIITTDSIGCRNTVDDGVNGFLCKPRNPEDLARKMQRMTELTLSERTEMGYNGRSKMVDEFDEGIVIVKYCKAIKEIKSEACGEKYVNGQSSPLGKKEKNNGLPRKVAFEKPKNSVRGSYQRKVRIKSVKKHF